VLFRTNDQSRVLEQAFRQRKIPYRVVGARSFYRSAGGEGRGGLLEGHQRTRTTTSSLLRILNVHAEARHWQRHQLPSSRGSAAPRKASQRVGGAL
jgi:superfamily I DNA/RNA helicase